MIAIIDYGLGNLRSVQKALEKVGADAVITSEREDLIKADKIVLPGVGAIKPAMDKLQELDLIDEIKRQVKAGKPFFGICVGFQLLFESSDEGGNVEALGLLKGRIQKFQNYYEIGSNCADARRQRMSAETYENTLHKGMRQTTKQLDGLKKFHVKVPQMGWNQINIQKESPLVQGIQDGSDVYFCHSYHATDFDPDDILTTTSYGIEYPSSVQKNNICGVQFHPEKSQNVGLKILENFVKW